MKIQELFEAAGSNLKMTGFMHKSLFPKMVDMRAAVKAAAEEFGVKATVKGVNDKDMPGYDVMVSGPEQAVAKFAQKIMMKKGTSLKKSLEFARAQRVDLNERIEAVDPSENVGSKSLYDYCAEEMADTKDDLQDSKTAGSSYSLGGSMRANVSGDVKLVKNFTSTSYGSSTHWDLCLQVGNGIKGEKALDVVKRLYKDFLSEAKGMDPKKIENFDGTFHAYFDDGSVSVTYEYASSFSWVAIRHNKR